MESLSCLVLKPAAPTRFLAPRLSGSGTFPSSLVCPSSMDCHLPRTNAKQSFKPTKALSSAVSTTPLTTSTVTNTSSASTKKVLIPIGFGTEEMEAVILVDVLRRAGAELTVASVEPQLEILASGGTRLVADTAASCSNQVFDLVVLPGEMPGAARLRDCEILKKITSKQAEEKRLYGGISIYCSSGHTSPLGNLEEVVYIKIGFCARQCILIAKFDVVCHARQLATLHSLTSFQPSGLSNQIFKFQESLQAAKALELLFCLLWP